MTVAEYKQTNFNTDTPSGYKGGIDANFSVLKRLGDGFGPHAQTTPNMTVRIDAGSLPSLINPVEVAAQSTGTITAPVGNPRIDRVVINATTGAVSVITGTPAASPVAPDVTDGNLPVCQVLLQTTSTVITNSMITDERVVPAWLPGLIKTYKGNVAGSFINYTSNAPITSLTDPFFLVLTPSVTPSPGGWYLDVNTFGPLQVIRYDTYSGVQAGDVSTTTVAVLFYDPVRSVYVLLNPLTRWTLVKSETKSTTIVNSTIAGTSTVMANLASINLVAGEYVLLESQAYMLKGATAGMDTLTLSQSAGTATVVFDTSQDGGYCPASTANVLKNHALVKCTATGTCTFTLSGTAGGSNSTLSAVALKAAVFRDKI